MTDTLLPAESEFRVGNVINRATNVLFANFTFFFVVAVITTLPSVAFQSWETSLESETVLDFVTARGAFLVALIFLFLMSAIGEAIILVGALQYLHGEPVRPGEALRQGLAKSFPLLGLVILYTLAVGIGAVLLIVPGVFLMVIWSIVVPACVVEGLGPIASMNRSRNLTKGHRWKIFGTLAAIVTIEIVGDEIIEVMLSPAGNNTTVAISALWQGICSAFWHCVTLMIYHDLRVAKEGISSEQIAAVFD